MLEAPRTSWGVIISDKMSQKKPANFKPVKDWPKGHRWHKSDRSRCQAWAYGPGRQCEKQAMTNGEKCRNHGGASLKGAAAAHYVHGKYSKYAPKAIAARIDEYMQDPELLNLSEDVAVANARIEMLLNELSDGGSVEAWETLSKLYAALVEAIKQGQAAQIANLLNQIGNVIQSAQADNRAWGRIQSAQEHKVKIVGAEHKRRVDMQALLDRSELILIIDRIYDVFTYSLRQYVQDDRLFRRITSDTANGIRNLVSGNSRE